MHDAARRRYSARTSLACPGPMRNPRLLITAIALLVLGLVANHFLQRPPPPQFAPDLQGASNRSAPAARAAGKPVVVSMGGMAASGGYWISTPANYIVANPSTLTGSIGIFGVINTVENSLDYLGVHTDGVSTSPLADVSVTKSLPPEVSEMM